MPFAPLMSAAELLLRQPEHLSTELVRGRMVVREPPGTRHGLLSQTLALLLADHVRAHALGVLFGQDTGFLIRTAPDTVRAPDLAFVRQEHVRLIPPSGYARLAPDLVAEILSPGDRASDVLRKVQDWLEVGVSLVWVLDPAREDARVYRRDGSVEVIPPDGLLPGDVVLPGLRCALADVFRTTSSA